ncbi:MULTISPECIES: ribonuclease HII [Mesobacillus]|uniref:Ribonuclease HII n=2 Tax=Mesobacillus TaxID=2675231 RepID=A0A0D6Z8I0_9BACI|nr:MULTISPECIES: ribonuclease HII [Mesobacillus]KIY20883.1 ribonuclease H [Mesobacillus subterraneus]MDQ0412525.1 ribonuclease HII [Mesobacillus stamsii]
MNNWTIAEIDRLLFSNKKVDREFIEKWRTDNRNGVQKLIAKWEKQEVQKEHARRQFVEMTLFERKYWSEGFKLIAGIDEAGRGPLAGPVVAGAVILPEDFYLPGLNDSKKLSKAKREEFFDIIHNQALSVGVGIIEAAEIDEINILEASKKAMLQATAQLKILPDFLLIDAVKLETPYPFEALIKGDARSVSIAAASVIAKVTRDRLMMELDDRYPQYGFQANMGYGTAAHLTALKEHGVTDHHRKTFAPVRECIQQTWQSG